MNVLNVRSYRRARVAVGSAAITLLTLLGIQACASSGSGTIRGEIPSPVGGHPVRFKAKIKWGPAETQPSGASLACYLSVGGEEIEIWEKAGPPKQQWFHEPDTNEWNRIIGGSFSCVATNGFAGTADPVEFTASGSFSVDTVEKTSSLTFDLPSGAELVDPASPGAGEPPIPIEFSATPVSGGWHIVASGQINDIAKWAMFQRLKTFTASIAEFGEVNVSVNPEYSLIVVTDKYGNLVPAEYDPVRPIIWNP